MATAAADDESLALDVIVDKGHGVESTKQVVIKKEGAAMVASKKRRPARRQAESKTSMSQMPPQTGQVFNIWYGKWSGGDREDKFVSQNHAETRCNIAKDTGYTRADKVAGSFFCLFFARGMCPNGPTCEYLHRLPEVHDIFDPNVDCFGRDKHADYRDDMGGVGSFLRHNRTLYIGRVNVTEDIEEIFARHFAEWGPIERIRVLNSRGVGFVTYSRESNAQFAKEAMAHQSLDGNEVLNVRWASRDPNPMSAARDQRAAEEQALEAVRRALPAAYVAELEGRGDAESKKKRKLDRSLGVPGYEAPDEIWFARGKDAVNPAGRLIEDGNPSNGHQSASEYVEAEKGATTDGGLISSHTLEALQALAETSKFKPRNVQKHPRSLVAYGSDEE